MRIVIGCDHAGYEYKDRIAEILRGEGHEVIDVGTNGPESIDYPDYAAAACAVYKEGRADRGILICGSGIGISIAANKVNGIRCALAHDHLSASLCRQHNDANFVALGARLVGFDVAMDIVHTFLSTDFLGDRHQRRVDKITALEAAQK